MGAAVLLGLGEQGSLSPVPHSPEEPRFPTTTAPAWEGRWVGAVASDQPLPDPRPATADLLSSLEDLELSNRRLAGENAKLQRSLETAEEGSTRLGEEIAALRKQLRRWALHVLSLHLLPCLPPCTVPSALPLSLWCFPGSCLSASWVQTPLSTLLCVSIAAAYACPVLFLVSLTFPLF